MKTSTPACERTQVPRTKEHPEACKHPLCTRHHSRSTPQTSKHSRNCGGSTVSNFAKVLNSMERISVISGSGQPGPSRPSSRTAKRTRSSPKCASRQRPCTPVKGPAGSLPVHRSAPRYPERKNPMVLPCATTLLGELDRWTGSLGQFHGYRMS